MKKPSRCEICGVPVVSMYTHRCRLITVHEKLADAIRLADHFGIQVGSATDAPSAERAAATRRSGAPKDSTQDSCRSQEARTDP